MTYRQTDREDNRLMAFFPGQPGQAKIRKVKPVWILMKQEVKRWQMGWRWHHLNHMQIICTSIHTD